MVAVLTIEPVATWSTVPVTVNVALPPGARVIGVLIDPVPLAELHVLPAVTVQLHDGDSKIPGSESATVAFTTVEGPALVARMV
jgi:hypothetical protein